MSGEFQGREGKMNKVGAGVQSLIRQDQYANLMVTQGLPPLVDLAINRKLVAASSAGGTAKAPVAAMPTTAAAWALYNPASSNKLLIVLRAFSWLVSGTTGLGGAQMVCKTNVAQAAALTAYASSVKQELMSGYSSVGIFAGGATLAETPAWIVSQARNTLATDALGSGFSQDFNGEFVIEEGCCFGLTVMDEAGTTPLFGGGFIWAEVDLSLS